MLSANLPEGFMPHVYIEDIAKYEGQEVTLKGWVYNRTDKGRLRFVIVRDGSGLIQAVVFQKGRFTGSVRRC